MQAKRWFVGAMMVVSALVGCGPAVENEESAEKPVSASGDPYTPCTRNIHCTEFGQLYCGGDPGMCFQNKYCLCP